MANDSDYASPIKDEKEGASDADKPVGAAATTAAFYNSTEDFRDGVNEMVEDEAHMAQKTAYYLEYRSKFKQLNSEELKSSQYSAAHLRERRQYHPFSGKDQDANGYN